MQSRRQPVILTLALLMLLANGVPLADIPSRSDHGHLIVLDVRGSYEEMGQQIIELLGEDARRVYALNREFYERNPLLHSAATFRSVSMT